MRLRYLYLCYGRKITVKKKMNKQGFANFKNVWLQWWHRQGLRIVGGPREAPQTRIRKRDKFMLFFHKKKAPAAEEANGPLLPGNFVALPAPVAPGPKVASSGEENHTMLRRIRLVLKKVETQENGAELEESNAFVPAPPSRSSSFPPEVGPGATTTAVSVVSAKTT